MYIFTFIKHLRDHLRETLPLCYKQIIYIIKYKEYFLFVEEFNYSLKSMSFSSSILKGLSLYSWNSLISSLDASKIHIDNSRLEGYSLLKKMAG